MQRAARITALFSHVTATPLFYAFLRRELHAHCSVHWLTLNSYYVSTAAVTIALEEPPEGSGMTNHTGSKSNHVDNHESIVTSYKELIREQVQYITRVFSCYRI